MNNKGITLITVVVIIIVMIIIATTSIIAGNKLIVNSKNYKDSQTLETVKEAISRRIAEIAMQGTITPKGDSFPGKIDPLIGDGTISAKGWYLLEESDLVNLGIKDIETRFLVNYDYVEVLDFSDNQYLEKYFVVTFMHKIIDDVETDPLTSSYIGEKLANKTGTEDTTHKMYKDDSGSTPQYYGDGWYVVTPAEMKAELTQIENIKYYDFDNAIINNYLVNYKNSKYVAITPKFSEV